MYAKMSKISTKWPNVSSSTELLSKKHRIEKNILIFFSRVRTFVKIQEFLHEFRKLLPFFPKSRKLGSSKLNLLKSACILNPESRVHKKSESFQVRQESHEEKSLNLIVSCSNNIHFLIVCSASQKREFKINVK